jgi:hypothetical protein
MKNSNVRLKIVSAQSRISFQKIKNRQTKRKNAYLKKKSIQLANLNKPNENKTERIANEFLSNNLNDLNLDEFQDNTHESNIKNLNEKKVQSDEEEEEFAELENENEDYDEYFEATNENSKYDFIYSGSKLTVKEFNLLFRWICQKMRISKIDRNLLLTFIKTLLPANNKIPSSYYSLIKCLKKKTNLTKKCFKICSNCYGLFKNGCENESCTNLKKNLSIDALVFDFESHLRYIIQKYWKEIQIYKGKLYYK